MNVHLNWTQFITVAVGRSPGPKWVEADGRPHGRPEVQVV